MCVHFLKKRRVKDTSGTLKLIRRTDNTMAKKEKSKITNILNLEENQFGKSIITWQNQITKRIKNEWTRTVIFLTWCRPSKKPIVVQ